MVMENPGSRTNVANEDWIVMVEALLFWFAEFFPVLQEQAKKLEVSDQALAELAMAKELFLGGFCPCHLFYDPAIKPDFQNLFLNFEKQAQGMVERIRHHPAMTEELRLRMGIQHF